MSIENRGESRDSYNVLEGADVLEGAKAEHHDLAEFLEELMQPSISDKEFSRKVGDFNQSYMHEKEGMYRMVFIEGSRKLTLKCYENGSMSISTGF